MLKIKKSPIDASYFIQDESAILIHDAEEGAISSLASCISQIKADRDSSNAVPRDLVRERLSQCSGG